MMDESHPNYRFSMNAGRETSPEWLIQNGPRPRNVVENVLIPNHILRTTSTRRERHEHTWQPRRASSVKNDYLQKIVQPKHFHLPSTLNRSNTVNLGDLGRSRSIGFDSQANQFRISAPRNAIQRRSLPVVFEGSAVSLPSTPSRSEAAPFIEHCPQAKRTSRTILYRSLEGFSFGGSDGSSTPRHEEPDPLFVVQGPAGILTSDRHGPIEQEHRTALKVLPNAVQDVAQNVAGVVRRSSIADAYERAKLRGQALQRKKWVQNLFEYTFYTILLCFVYFVLIGVPFWRGTVWWLWWVVDHKFVFAGGFSITVGLAAIYASAPLLIFFENDPPSSGAPHDSEKGRTVDDTALLIPCYKSEKLIGATLKAALKIFPASHIFVLANGNSPTPLDNTEDVCRAYGVNHVWCPVGSKIVAQFVGCYAAKGFKNVLLIDDDCALPPNFPIVSDRTKGKVKCIGYTIKSVGPDSSRGTLCQQAQDLEYKISGLQRALAGKIGSATFPHGAISLWDRKFFLKTFYEHPGFSVSEDWFFGHVARKLGCRIQMCTSVFVETETPPAVFFSSGGARGGFGEMTVFKQRFKRWNFFFVNGMYYNMAYILGSWNLGWWELGAKLFVFQEVYETLLYLLTPFILPISFIVRPSFCGYLLLGTIVMYLANVVVFNELHLRRKKERVGSLAVYFYYMPYKVGLTAINVASCYWSLYKYARYFARRHPKVVEDEKAVEVVLRLEEQPQSDQRQSEEGRRMTVTAIGTCIPDANAATNRNSGLPAEIGEGLPEDSVMAQRLNLTQRERLATMDFTAQPPAAEEVEMRDWAYAQRMSRSRSSGLGFQA